MSGVDATDATAVNNSTRVEFGKIYKDFQITINPLKKAFAMEDTIAKQKYFEFLSQVSVRDSDRKKGIANANRLANTAAAKIPTWMRRVNDYREAPLHVAVPRLDAKIVGLPMGKIVKEYKPLFKWGMVREYIDMMLNLIVSTYKVNPVIANNNAITYDSYFRDDSEHMFASSGNLIGAPDSATHDGRVAIPPAVGSWFYLTSSLANARKLSVARGGQLSEGTGIPKQEKCLVICTNDAFAHFKHSNQNLLGDREKFGDDIYLGNGAKLMEFQEFKFLTLPDGEFPVIDKSPATPTGIQGDPNGAAKGLIYFPKPSLWTNQETPLLTAASIALAGADANAQAAFRTARAREGRAVYSVSAGNATDNTTIGNCYPLLVIEPNAFRMQMPKQMQVPMHVYRDKDKSFEKFIFGHMALEGVVLFPRLIRRVWITGERQIGFYNSSS